MSEGARYQSIVEEWAKLINAPEEHKDDLDIYAQKMKDHNTMANMYKEIPDDALDTHKFGSVHFLLSGLPTINWILRHTLLPKSGDRKMISAPAEHEDDLDVYAKNKKYHNTMDNMYKEIPDDALDTHKSGSVHFLLSSLPTINWILRHTLLPKSGDHKMIRGHAINLLHIFDVP